ncbi:hypothetical protein [Streptomyces mobaraensis]|uniref:Uncharacterized protein n=1 Tax=Streptomyces mobaraensis TaxID=35621 RepID=A0A5N5W873_STRMB|nr:hypothetical protein [Streptomyces mobaraensis]KAB7845516.1 hypothetical protein FRZ00_13575 [Streptomyces mobaraensis]
MRAAVRLLRDAPPRARVRTAWGRAVVRWCGPPGAADGAYAVEWTVDEDVTWGRNTRPAAVPAPGLRPEGDRVVLRGRLHADGDGTAWLAWGPATVLLDVTGPLPDGADGQWVELRCPAARVALYPYDL